VVGESSAPRVGWVERAPMGRVPLLPTDASEQADCVLERTDIFRDVAGLLRAQQLKRFGNRALRLPEVIGLERVACFLKPAVGALDVPSRARVPGSVLTAFQMQARASLIVSCVAMWSLIAGLSSARFVSCRAGARRARSGPRRQRTTRTSQSARWTTLELTEPSSIRLRGFRPRVPTITKSASFAASTITAPGSPWASIVSASTPRSDKKARASSRSSRRRWISDGSR
jgi:hypothetical protein